MLTLTANTSSVSSVPLCFKVLGLLVAFWQSQYKVPDDVALNL
jgi:hypothetical protein